MSLCGNCFREPRKAGPCPYCGWDGSGQAEKYPLALKVGAILNGRYTVGRVLGQGGFGVTYIAQDYNSKQRVAIKEYLPTEMAGRNGSTCAVQLYSGERRENFEYGKEQFLQEAKTLANFIGDAHIVRIHSYFEENATAYFVMDYVEGQPLNRYMTGFGGRLSVEEAGRLLLPLMESLARVHAAGIIHRDIAPDNIIVQPDGSAKLIDFGAARYSNGEKSKSLDVILKHGFAPKEQYARRGRQGPFTDIYALGATFYYAITGKVPPEAIERIDDDSLIPPSTLGVQISSEAEEVLFKALEVSAPDRYQSMADFHRELSAALAAAPQADPEEIKRTLREEQARLEQEKQEFQTAKARLETENRRLREEKERLEREAMEKQAAAAAPKKPSKAPLALLAVAAVALIAFGVVKLMGGGKNPVAGNRLLNPRRNRPLKLARNRLPNPHRSRLPNPRRSRLPNRPRSRLLNPRRSLPRNPHRNRLPSLRRNLPRSPPRNPHPSPRRARRSWPPVNWGTICAGRSMRRACCVSAAAGPWRIWTGRTSPGTIGAATSVPS